MQNIDQFIVDFEIRLTAAADTIWGCPLEISKYRKGKEVFWTTLLVSKTREAYSVLRVALQPPPDDEDAMILVEWRLSAEGIFDWDWTTCFTVLTTHVVDPEKPLRFLKDQMDRLVMETGHKNIFR